VKTLIISLSAGHASFCHRYTQQRIRKDMLHPTHQFERLPDLESSVTKQQTETVSGGETVYSQILWLFLWMGNNIGVTLLNKAAFNSVDFNYPYALSAVHMLCNAIGAFFFQRVFSNSVKIKKLEWEHQKIILAFSFLFAANIAVGNDSLRHVSISFNQVMRSVVPGVVMLMGMCTGKTFSTSKKLAVLCVVVGIATATFGEIRFTVLGFVITCLCVLLAALKVVISGLALTGEMKLDPLDLLIKMSPLACVECLVMSHLQGELAEIYENWDNLVNSSAFFVVFFTGVLAFSLNILSFTANKVTSPLTLTVAANLKQAILIAVGYMTFGNKPTLPGIVGVCIVILGSARYSQLSFVEQNKKFTKPAA